MKTLDFLKLFSCILACEVAGIVGMFFMSPAAMDWYDGLVKPNLTPPEVIFGPVWVFLYALMGIAVYLIWNKGFKKKEVKWALISFDIQLALNVLWTILFFGLRNPSAAFVEILVLDLSIILVMAMFIKISRPAAFLLLPYLVWICFATYLSYGFWQLDGEQVRVYCTQEAMLCPDGSYVGRTEPNCEFSPCPEPTLEEGWLKENDTETATSFEYPAELETTYISALDWPPTIEVSSQSFSCEGTQTINNHSYCVTSTTEGAAGSVYTEYSYSFPKDDQTVTLSFTLQSTQCGNYDETEMAACEEERSNFDLDQLVDKIAQSVKFEGAMN